MKDDFFIPVYFEFKFYTIEMPYEQYKSQWDYGVIRTDFWQETLADLFGKTVSLYKNWIDMPTYGDDRFGISVFTNAHHSVGNKMIFSIEQIIKNRLSEENEKYKYEPHDIESVGKQLEAEGVGYGASRDFVKTINNGERRIFEWYCDYTRCKKWDRLRHEFLTHKFMVKKLTREGIPHDLINYDLIATERLLIQTKRELKNYKNDNLSNMLRRFKASCK